MSEKYLGEVSTPLLINQIKENCAQKRSTLPLASIDELGHIYQYMGVTSGSLVHGYFYECVSDGQDPATYSWQQVNTQPTAPTPTAATTTFDNTTSGLQATNVQGAIDEVVDGIGTDVDNIKDVIPSTATSSNKLVDHDSLGTAAFKDFTPNVAPNNHNLVESNAVYNAITTALTSIYTPRGDLSCAELTSSLLVAANVGNIYEMSDSGTTSALFLQGAGKTIHVGDNVGIIQTGVDTYKFNLMANAFDMTDYQKKDLTQAIEGATTVEGALGTLNTKEKDDIQDVYAVMGQNGAKNLAKPINSISYLDVNVVCDENGVLSLTGTASGSGGRLNIVSDSFMLKAGTYKVVHTSNDLTKYSSMVCHKKADDTSLGYSLINNGTIDNSHAQFTLASDTECFMGMNTYQGTNYGTGTGTKEYVMVVLVDDVDATYQPYAKTNRELTEDVKGLIDNVNVLGAKNLFNTELGARVSNGITYTRSDDGSITANGTATEDSWNVLCEYKTLKAGKYVLSGCPSGGSSSTYFMYTEGGITNYDYGNGRTFTLASDTSIRFGICVKNGQSLSNLKFYPMIRLASDPDDTYMPYAMTNRDLTVNYNMHFDYNADTDRTDIANRKAAVAYVLNNLISFKDGNEIAYGTIRYLGGFYHSYVIIKTTIAATCNVFEYEPHNLPNMTGIMYAAYSSSAWGITFFKSLTTNIVTSGTCTKTSACTATGSISWVRNGNIVTLKINLDSSTDKVVPANTKIATGAPTPSVEMYGWGMTGIRTPLMFSVSTNGDVYHTNGGSDITNQRVYGTITYITND